MRALCRGSSLCGLINAMTSFIVLDLDPQARQRFSARFSACSRRAESGPPRRSRRSQVVAALGVGGNVQACLLIVFTDAQPASERA